MGKQRKVWSTEVKEAAVLRLLGNESPAKICRDIGCAEGQLYKWRANFLEGGRQGLGKGYQSVDAALEAQNDRLKRLLAEKELELDLAKKARGL